MQNHREKSIIVTGGARGIGAEIVRLCSQAGYDVCFTFQQQHDAANALVAQCHTHLGKVVAIQADVSDHNKRHAVLAAACELSPLYGLVNNAGITSLLGRFEQVDEATIRQVFEINVMGTMLMSQQAIRYWLQHNQPGNIVNVSSIAAKTGSPNEYVHYAASKAAVESFTIGLAKEVAAQQIRVNAVSPGITRTEIHALSGEPNRPDHIASKIPMQRAAEASEIAEAVRWLLSPAASYMTGAIVPVAGGL